ncbi:MAG: HEAT repeat domain-containing protein [Coriobacteriia bacterium]|nr:HEAT repeat domain-containing protein [Coriobacteriia bacterium]
MAARRGGPQAPPIIEGLLKALVVAEKAYALYPPTSHIPLETASSAAQVLSEALAERPEVRLIVTKQGLFYGDAELFPGQSAYMTFALALYNRHLADVRFHAGTTAKDIVAFLEVLALDPDTISEGGGFESRLWEAGVGTITVTEAHVTIVDVGDAPGQVNGAASSRADIDEILASAYGGRSRDQLTVARFLGDKTAVAKYLTETHAGSGTTPDLMGTAERFAELAEIAYEVGTGSARAQLLRSLGEAFQELDPALRRSLLVDEMLPEARTNEALAAVIRQMDIDSVCRALVGDLDETEASREGLARAIRTLSLISLADRQEVAASAGAAMREAGFCDAAISEVLELAAPSRLTVRESTSAVGSGPKPADAILKLMDMAPTPQRTGSEEDDRGLVEIRTEARSGITDGDVIMALVSLVAMDSREVPFASTMSLLEDSLDLLVERGEIEIAADAADALTAASQNEELDSAQRMRLRKAIGRFTKPGDIRSIAHALRLYAPGTPEHEAARRLLDALGPLAIEPLLEQLADEQEMLVRKAIVELLSAEAMNYVQELGSHVGDQRWYVVRNVVSILGSTHSSAVLPYLERTVRHPEPRVRREVLRALSGINDRIAQEMLVGVLDDNDAQNVQLAARYLGASDIATAVPALERVARGEGRGNRDSGPRVEAIEALGRRGAIEALPTLESLAGKRSILGAGKAREIRAASESAISAIKAKGVLHE